MYKNKQFLVDELQGENFDNLVFKNCHFIDTNLKLSIFSSCKFTDCDFSGVIYQVLYLITQRLKILS